MRGVFAHRLDYISFSSLKDYNCRMGETYCIHYDKSLNKNTRLDLKNSADLETDYPVLALCYILYKSQNIL